MGKYVIGIDLGINNVGWSIIDENTRNIEMGVRLFNESSAAQDRRSFRAARRLRKRSKTRVDDLLNIFKSIDFPTVNVIDSNLLYKRVKGLKEKITKEDIVNICCYYATHRGYIPFGDEEPNRIDLNGQYPAEYYYRLYNDIGKYRALDKVINNSDIIRELTSIISKQIEYYPELLKIKEDIISIICRKRKFWEGPGSVISLTKYGRFKNEDDVIKYKEMRSNGQEKYLYDDLIGKCSIYVDERVTTTANYYYEEFNLLNDFINTSITSLVNVRQDCQNCFEQNKATGYYKLNTRGLELVIDYCKNNVNASYDKIYKDLFGVKKEDLSGYRIDKNNKPEFSTLKIYRSIKKAFLNLTNSWIDDISRYNKILDIMAICPGIVEIRRLIEESKLVDFNEDDYQVLKTIQDKLKASGVLKYGKFSEKLLKRAINDMLSTCMNYQQVSKKFDYEKDAREYFRANYQKTENIQLMDAHFVDDIISSPQVKKSLRQAIKVINAIIAEKGEYPDIIAVESAKELNGQEKLKIINKEQRQNEEKRKTAVEKLRSSFSDEYVTEVNVLKTMLYDEVDSRCPYCGNPFNGGLNAVINGTIEIEHILPLSKSFDNSYNNKTLACRECNDNKGNRTPYMWMSPEKFQEFALRIAKLNISDEKKANFYETKDIDKYTTRFFNRNLRDTAYGTKELVNQIKIFNDYLSFANESVVKIKTLSTPGQLTGEIRKKIQNEKNRDAGKFHHAVDATIVAGIALDSNIGKLLLEAQNESDFWFKNKKLPSNIDMMIENLNLEDISNDIKDIKSDDDIKISCQVVKDPDRSIANANIYKYLKKDDCFYKVSQINDIYDDKLDLKVMDKLFNENDLTCTLMIQDNNPKMFEKLKAIYTDYKSKGNSKNPFLNYVVEVNAIDEKEFNYLKHGIRQNNGPVIKKLRYYTKSTSPDLLNKKNMTMKDNTYIGFDGVKQYCTQVYWDNDKEKFIFMPIYITAIDPKTKKVNKDSASYQEFYRKYLEGKNVKHIVDLFNGNLIEVVKGNSEVVSMFVKGFNKHTNVIESKKLNEVTKIFVTSDKSLTVYDVDYLGNKKVRLTWPEK